MNSVYSDSGPMAAQGPVLIGAGGLVAEVLGGPLLSVTSLRHRGEELLVEPTELPLAYRVHARRAGITLLHPWANRLGADTYRFGQVTGHLDRSDPVAERAVTRDANGLAIHGLTAPCPWRPEPDGASACHASLTWLGTPAFPFAHQVLVRLQVSDDSEASGAALMISTTITSLSSAPVPVSIGWHPYFRCDRQAGCELELPALSVLDADARGLPTGACTPREPARIPLLDQSFDDGALLLGSQMIMHQSSPDGPDRSITVEFDQGYPYGQVFAPHDAPVVSLEPMTAPTNALCGGVGMPSAAADRPYTADFTVRVR